MTRAGTQAAISPSIGRVLGRILCPANADKELENAFSDSAYTQLECFYTVNVLLHKYV